ncbi:MAG TPA: hypothetical protein VGQ57_03345, partial [Polyangiaceae bacterium]|nr:hypothetical protein [Polyangiaceae bacterium]
MRFTTLALLPLAALTCTLGCQKEDHEKSAPPAASVDKAAAIDPELAKAVAAASAGVGQGAAPVGSGQPPPGGIFPPGGADREMPKGLPPKLTLGGTGAEPRVKLTPAQPKPGTKTTGKFDVAVQADSRQGALPVSIATSFEVAKTKTEGAVAAAPGTLEPVTVTVRVTGVKLGVAGVPADFEARFAKLKGAKIEYQVAANGAGSNFRTELPPGAAETRDHLRVLADALALVTLPLPAEPVGAGAMWMVTSREGVFGLDLVTYRLVKVDAVTADSATLSLVTK